MHVDTLWSYCLSRHRIGLSANNHEFVNHADRIINIRLYISRPFLITVRIGEGVLQHEKEDYYYINFYYHLLRLAIYTPDEYFFGR